MSQKFFNLQNKMKIYKELTKKNSLQGMNPFFLNIENYIKFSDIIHKICKNEVRKQEYFHWTQVGCE